MENDLDKKLYNNYLNGEKQAFEFLYNKYKSKIENFIFNIIKDYQKAEDLTQETFIYVMQNEIKTECSFKYYIYLVAKSKTFNYIKVKNRRNEIIEQYVSINTDQIEKDVLEIITDEETKKELIKSIELLDDKYKNAVYLTSIEKLSYRETAKILGESTQNIKNLVHRGKKNLRKILLKKGFDNMNKVTKIVLIVIGVGILSTGIAYGATKIYEEILKSYYQEETVDEPVSDSQAPTGEVVYKNFTIKEKEKNITLNGWDEDEYTYYKQINTYDEYKNLMNNYSDLRKLTENDFKNYFAFIILNKDNSYELKYKFITYNEDTNGNDPILNINIFKNELTNNNNPLNQGLVVIMTQRHRDYKIIPQIIN